MANLIEAITLSSDSESEATPAPSNSEAVKPKTEPAGQAANVDVLPLANENEPTESEDVMHLNMDSPIKKRVTRSQINDGTKKTPNYTTKKKKNWGQRCLKGLNADSEFLGKFDPENSNREKRKLSQKFPDAAKSKDPIICDCFNDTCPGCFFPCHECKSRKCGLVCPTIKNFVVNSIESEATHVQKFHPSVRLRCQE